MSEQEWDHWTGAVARDLAELVDGDWLVWSVHVPSRSAVDHAARPARRGWRRVLAAPPPAPRVPDVSLQARATDGILVLECIGDEEFEGVSDLTRAHVASLVAFGWEVAPGESDLVATFTLDETIDAAELLSASLRGPLGAGSPDDLALRRSRRDQVT